MRIEGKGDEAEVWIEMPHVEGRHEWEVVEFRGVSEEFADPPPLSMTELSLSDTPSAGNQLPSTTPVTMPEELPTSLLGFAHLVLATPDPSLKCALTRQAVALMRAGNLKSIRPSIPEVKRVRQDVGLLDEPPRQQPAVAPGQVSKR